MALLAGIVVLAGFYVSAGVNLVIDHTDSVNRRDQVIRLQQENAALLAKKRALVGPLGVAAEARRLGMVMPGEIPYVVTGLPSSQR